MAAHRHQHILNLLGDMARSKDTWAIRALTLSRFLELMGLDTTQIMESNKIEIYKILELPDDEFGNAIMGLPDFEATNA